MELLPFGELKAYRPRRFLSTDVDLGDWDQVAPWYDRLEERIGSIDSPAGLERWLHDMGELEAALEEEGVRRYIAMTCHTDHPESERAYLDFVENVEPQIKPRHFRLVQAYLNHPLRPELRAERYEVFDRNAGVEAELYRSENVPLETEETKLGQQYQKLCGSLTVSFQGEEKTLPQMAPYLEEPDRSLRQEAWALAGDRRLQEKDRFEALFDDLFRLRGRIAANAGFEDYRAYAFRAHRRFDYGPEDCLAFHEAVEQEVMPAVRRLQERRRQSLDLETLRPWDLAVDPANRPPLKPFSTVEDLVERMERLLERVDVSIARGFRKLREWGLLDLDNRKGKAPGGYQTALPEARVPFIFMNAVGVQQDVETLLHESGHACHTLSTQEEDFRPYRDAPIEFCEVASMTLELIGNESLDTFLEPDEARRARRDHLEGVLRIFPWIATIDAFQHWLYTHPQHTPQERRRAWLETLDRFTGDVDWTDHEEKRAYLWHRQLHLFLDPFYYIEYGIAQLGALQIWDRWKQDPETALESYRKALALGGSRPLPELFEAAGCRFRFDSDTLRPLVKRLQEELDALERPSDAGSARVVTAK